MSSGCEMGVQSTVVVRQRLPEPACKPSDKTWVLLENGHDYRINEPLAIVPDSNPVMMRPFQIGDPKVDGIRTCAIDLTNETEPCELAVCEPCCCNKEVAGIHISWPEGMQESDVEALNFTAKSEGDCCAFNFFDIPCFTDSKLPCIEGEAEAEPVKAVS